MVLPTYRGALIQPCGGDGVGWVKKEVLHEVKMEMDLEGEIGDEIEVGERIVPGRVTHRRGQVVLCQAAGSLLWWGYGDVCEAQGGEGCRGRQEPSKTVISELDAGQ